MSSGNVFSARRVTALHRQQRAVELRRAGCSYREIGKAIGIGTTSAHRLVSQAVAEARNAVADDVNEMRALELSRLDALLGGLWADARRGHLGAIDRVLKIMERRAKLLGLDAPARVSRAAVARDEVERDPTSYIVPVPVTLSIEKWMAQFGSPGAADGKREAG